MNLSGDADHFDEAKVTSLSIGWLFWKRILKEFLFDTLGRFLGFVFWFLDWLGTALVLALVVHVSFDGGFGVGRVFVE